MSVPIAYDAPAGCPTAEVFRAEVDARAPEGSAEGTSFVVRVERWAGYIGTLRVVDAGGTAERTVEGQTCAEVTHALAIAIATACEPPSPPPPTSTQAAPEAPAPSPLSPKESAAPPQPAPAPARAAAGASIGAAGGLGPSFAPEIGLFAERAWGARAVRVEIAAAVGASIPADGGHALLDRGVLRAEGCPLAVEVATVRASACAGIEGGALLASGRDIVGAEGKVRPWIGAEATARGRWVFARPAFVELTGRVAVPFVRGQYYFRPDSAVYEIPVLVGGAAVNGGVLFW